MTKKKKIHRFVHKYLAKKKSRKKIISNRIKSNYV